MNSKSFKIGMLVLSIFVIGLTTIASYAYFSANISGNNNAETSVITTGHMEITYAEGNVIGTTSNMVPGNYVSKSFTVTNTGTVDSAYNIYLNEVLNTFNTKSDLVYELITEDGRVVGQTTCPSANTTIAQGVSINAGDTHHYTLKITFLETNDVQDDNKGVSFTAKIGLVEELNTMVNQIMALKNDGATDLEYDGVSSLGQYGTVDNNLRYIGRNPSNYIYFNCSTTDPSLMNDSTCEKWRIIGVMNNVEDENNNSSSRIKIVRNEDIGSYSWDFTDFSINYYGGINQWGPSTYEDGTPYEGADLMRELNTDYLGNITVGTDGKWYDASDGADENNKIAMPSTLLNANAVDMIQTVKWNLGTPNYEEETIMISDQGIKTPSIIYSNERLETRGKVCENVTVHGANNCNDTVVRTSSWTGKVALMYASDYGFSTSGGSTNNRTDCLSMNMTYWMNEDEEDCRNNTWMYYLSLPYYLLSPVLSRINANGVFYINDYHYLGSPTDGRANEDYYVYPSLYLKNSVSIYSGDGSSSNPYKLVM